MPKRTPYGKVIVYDIRTGEALERWPVDARTMVAQGDYAYKLPTDNPVSAEAETGEDAAKTPPSETNAHPSGGPLKVTPREKAGDAKPFVPPAERTSAAKK